jgi:hypothetical protein
MALNKCIKFEFDFVVEPVLAHHFDARNMLGAEGGHTECTGKQAI